MSTIPMMGQSWKLLNPVLSHTIVTNSQNPHTLWVGNWAHQLYRSYDAGTSWTIVEIGSTDVPNFLMSIVTAQTDTNVIVVGGFGVDGIRRSIDAGRTWTRVLTDSARLAMYFISEAILEDISQPGRYFGARGTPPRNNSIWESINNGATWDSISVLPPNFTDRLCTIAQRKDSANILFVGCRGGIIARSDDRGRTWRAVPVLRGMLNISGDAEVPKIVFSARYPRVGYAIVAITSPDSINDNGGVLKTVDGGATWDRIAFADTSLWSVDVRDGANGEDDVFIGGFRTSNRPTTIKGDGLVARSTDGGQTWSQYTDIPWGINEREDTIRNVWSIHCEPKLKRVYMTAETGTYILNEPTSAVDNNETDSHQTLRYTVGTNEIVVTDLDPTDDHTSWTLYTMNGNLVLSGDVVSPDAQRISTTSLASGLYLLTWGSERRFRTAHIPVVR